MATIPMSVTGALGSSTKAERTCIYCCSDELYRQRPRGIIEQHIFRAFDFVPTGAPLATVASTSACAAHSNVVSNKTG